ncbi:hypothetical protein F4818DRAFT_303317 [Hypoxylon cercidicola]|nr:hypothetical protein F4818DRAFT_303317 [Hypoxylon cercidicola]
MVTPACYPPSEAGRRYSRACPPYSIPYPDRRFHLSSSEGRTTTMTEREVDSESSQPRKRIAVACGRCRKRKIRCSGDPGNGLPCSNCKNAGYEPCLFLRVSSTETHLRNEGNEFSYNLDAARPYSNQTRVAVSPVSSMSQYAADTSGGDVMTSYRQNQYPYGGKGYYSAMSGWTGGYQDDGVDYSINYSHPMLGQDPAHMVQGYGRYGSGKSVYVDPETALYAYGNLVHRPAVTSESPTGFSLSGMAASLPNATDRVDPSDRLLPQVNRTLTGSSSYRTDGLPAYSSSKTSPTTSMPEVGYGGMNSGIDSPYSAPNALPSSVPYRSSNQHDGPSYQSNTTSPSDPLYPPADPSLRSGDDSSSGLSYIYSDKLDGSRRDSQSSGGASSGSVLPNGHVYVPDSHGHAPPPSNSSSQSYGSSSGSSSSAAAAVAVEGAAASTGGRGSRGSSHMHDGHRRSAGNLRG